MTTICFMYKSIGKRSFIIILRGRKKKTKSKTVTIVKVMKVIWFLFCAILLIGLCNLNMRELINIINYFNKTRKEKK